MNGAPVSGKALPPNRPRIRRARLSMTFRLSNGLNYTAYEVAAIAGISVGAARSRLKKSASAAYVLATAAEMAEMVIDLKRDNRQKLYRLSDGQIYSIRDMQSITGAKRTTIVRRLAHHGRAASHILAPVRRSYVSAGRGAKQVGLFSTDMVTK